MLFRSLDKGFSFKSIQSNSAESYVKVRSMRVEGSRLLISVESPMDIQEIRLNQNSPLSVLNPKDQAQVESIRSHYTVEHFDPKEFQQTRKGIMLDIIVPLNDRLSDEISERTSRVIARDDGSRALLNLELVDSSLGHYAFPLGKNGLSYNISRRPGGMSCNHVLAN